MYKRIDFSKFTSLKIGPVCDVFMIDNKHEIPKDHYLLGDGNNILVSDSPPPMMMLSKTFDYIHIEDNKLHVGAATKTGRVLSFCKKHNIANLEFLSKLPGTMGGVTFMNAGLKEFEIFNYIHAVVFKDYSKTKEQILYGYRYTNIKEIIFEIVINIEEGFSHERLEQFNTMRSNQPNLPSAGSCFANPEGDYAGRLIEAVGLKGYRKGNASFSEQHANFLVNHGNASFEDAIWLITEAERRVLQEFDITLRRENIVI